MNVTTDDSGRPTRCDHNVPDSEATVIAKLMVIGASIFAALTFLWWLNGETFEGPHTMNIPFLAGVFLALAMLIFRHQRKKARARIFESPETDVDALMTLFDRATEHGIELPALPREEVGDITNAELKQWAKQANDVLVRHNRANREHKLQKVNEKAHRINEKAKTQQSA